MNAAYLLVTSAWLAGQAAPPAAAPAAAPAPAPAAASYGGCNGGCGGGGCGGDCNACCDSGGLFGGGRLRGLFSKHKGGDCCDSCAPTCAQPTCAQPTCAASSCCDDGCGRQGLFSRLGGLCKRNKGCGNDCGTCATSCCDDGCGRSGLFGGGRLRGLFSKHKGGDCCDSCNTCGSSCGTGCANGGCGAAPAAAPAGAAPAGAEPIAPPKTDGEPKKMPESNNQAMKQVQIITPASETNNPFELHRRYESRVAHAPDFSWLTGQLFYVHADGGLWILRYAPLWQEDPNGGSIVLARDLRMGNYREGDLVTVHGEILSKKSSVFLGGPLYRAQSIELVDRDAK